MQRPTAARYNVALIEKDMTGRGWQPVDLAAKCRPRTAPSSVTRFLKGEVQTARMAKRLAKALGKPLDRYVLWAEGLAS